MRYWLVGIACIIGQTYAQKNAEKYLNGTLEPIVFYSQQNQSCERIARRGLLLKRPNATATVVIAHGFMCDKFDAGFIRLLFPNYNVLTFDFRAHGQNTDAQQFCTFGRDEAYDVAAAVDYVRSRKDLHGLPRIGYGFSMGAVATIQAQSQDPTLFDLLVLDCPFDDSNNLIKKGLENMKCNLFGYTFDLPGKSLLESYAYHPYVQSLLKAVLKTVAHMDATCCNTYIFPVSPADSIKKVTVPCLFIHCKHDEKVPVVAAKNIYASAPGFKRLWLTDGRRHFDSIFYHPEQYKGKVNSFVQKVFDGSYRQKCSEKIYADA